MLCGEKGSALLATAFNLGFFSLGDGGVGGGLDKARSRPPRPMPSLEADGTRLFGAYLGWATGRDDSGEERRDGREGSFEGERSSLPVSGSCPMAFGEYNSDTFRFRSPLLLLAFTVLVVVALGFGGGATESGSGEEDKAYGSRSGASPG